jgi:hypothetical protein
VDRIIAPRMAAAGRDRRDTEARARAAAVAAVMTAHAGDAAASPAAAAALLALGCDHIGETLGVSGFGGRGGGLLFDDAEPDAPGGSDSGGGSGGGGAGAAAAGALEAARLMGEALAALAGALRAGSVALRLPGRGGAGSGSGASSGGGGADDDAPPVPPVVEEARRLADRLRYEVEAEVARKTGAPPPEPPATPRSGRSSAAAVRPTTPQTPRAPPAPPRAPPPGAGSSSGGAGLLAPCLAGLGALAVDLARLAPPTSPQPLAPRATDGRTQMANLLAEMRWDIASRVSRAAADAAAGVSGSSSALRAAERDALIARRGAAMLAAAQAAAGRGPAGAAPGTRAAAAAALAAEGLDPARPSGPVRRLAYAELYLRSLAGRPLAEALPAAAEFLAALDAGGRGLNAGLELDAASAAAAHGLRGLLDEIALIDGVLVLGLGPDTAATLGRVSSYLDGLKAAAAAAAAAAAERSRERERARERAAAAAKAKAARRAMGPTAAPALPSWVKPAPSSPEPTPKAAPVPAPPAALPEPPAPPAPAPALPGPALLSGATAVAPAGPVAHLLRRERGSASGGGSPASGGGFLDARSESEELFGSCDGDGLEGLDGAFDALEDPYLGPLPEGVEGLEGLEGLESLDGGAPGGSSALAEAGPERLEAAAGGAEPAGNGEALSLDAAPADDGVSGGGGALLLDGDEALMLPEEMRPLTEEEERAMEAKLRALEEASAAAAAAAGPPSSRAGSPSKRPGTAGSYSGSASGAGGSGRGLAAFGSDGCLLLDGFPIEGEPDAPDPAAVAQCREVVAELLADGLVALGLPRSDYEVLEAASAAADGVADGLRASEGGGGAAIFGAGGGAGGAALERAVEALRGLEPELKRIAGAAKVRGGGAGSEAGCPRSSKQCGALALNQPSQPLSPRPSLHPVCPGARGAHVRPVAPPARRRAESAATGAPRLRRGGTRLLWGRPLGRHPRAASPHHRHPHHTN